MQRDRSRDEGEESLFRRKRRCVRVMSEEEYPEGTCVNARTFSVGCAHISIGFIGVSAV